MRFWTYLLHWLPPGRKQPVEIEVRNEPLYETMGQGIQNVVISPDTSTISMLLVNGWTIELRRSLDGRWEKPRWIEPCWDTSEVAIKNALSRLK